jgi:hypothetical protein
MGRLLRDAKSGQGGGLRAKGIRDQRPPRSHHGDGALHSQGEGPVGQPLPDKSSPPVRLAPHQRSRGGGVVVRMGISSRGAGARRLREAINALRAERTDKLDRRADELLARLVTSPDAAKAFERLSLKDGHKVAEVLAICIETDDLARTFPKWVAKVEKALVSTEQLDKAVAHLREFISEVDEQKVPLLSDLLSHSIFEPPASIEVLKHALDLIARRIDWGRGVAELALAQIGATRKVRNKEAAEIAAIWFLAARLHGAVGKPHLSEVADLAEVILRTEVSKDRLSHILRKRRRLYAKTIGDQTRRRLGNKIADARRR